MSFVPCVTNPLMKLRGTSWKDTPVRVCLCDPEDIEVVLGDEGTEAVVLGMRWRFWKPAEILEAQAKRVVQFQSGGGAPGAVEESSIVLIDLRWEMIPTRLEDIENLRTRVGHPPGPHSQLQLTNRHGRRRSD